MRCITFILLSLMLACSRNHTPTSSELELPAIKYGTFFGECLGYCKTELDIENSIATLVVSGWQPNEYPDKTETRQLSNSEWTDLTQALNWSKFKKQQEVIGCPDCTDGGAEWISVKFGEETKKVTFEYGKTLEGNEDILARLCAIHNSLRKSLE